MALDSRFNEVLCSAPVGSHLIVEKANEQGGFTIYGNGFRVLSITFGGGEFHVVRHGNVPDSDTCGFNVTDERVTVTDD